ncbi:hypothetical protein [Agarivorans aestuarii]|uniref:hypothetical protein n=1 Tax=Agarivorans aestuarii TaxID=1563703 RepID=UPI001C81EC6F|nr:hypothetical protein [Agarivorans aestuarii]
MAEQVAQEKLAWRTEEAFYQTLTANQLVLSEVNDKASLQQHGQYRWFSAAELLSSDEVHQNTK